MAASVASAGTSPLSGYDFQTESTGDPDENQWTILNPGSSVSSNAAFSFSPASLPGSLSSWAMLNSRSHQTHPVPSVALSPLNLDLAQSPSFPPSNYGDTGTGFSVTSAPADGQFIPDGQSYFPSDDNLHDVVLDAAFGSVIGDDQALNFTDAGGLLTEPTDYSNFLSSLGSLGPLDPAQQQDLAQISLDIPQPFQSGPDVPPWNHTNLASTAGDSPLFVMEGPGFVSPSPAPCQSPSVVTPPGASPQSPINFKLESGSGGRSSRKRPAATSSPIPIRRTRGAAGVQKKNKTGSDSAPRSSVGSSGSSTASQFLIVTPDSVHASTGNLNPFECFEAARPSHKGRKGPLPNETKESALQVRRVGACFCCHARKVKCDKERPCRNCTKLMVQVPQVICWQFQDFLPVLFPSFIRTHFRKEEMTKFITDNIEGFTVDGVEKPCVVELFSGANWESTFQIKAKFFTAKTSEVLQHWHMQIGRNSVDLQSREAPPIGLEMDGSHIVQRDEIKKKAREYIQSIIQEPKYAEQVTDSLRHTDLPRKILKIVQKYSQRTDHPIVKKALSIYAMHYVMTRHLCLTQRSLISLRSTNLVAQDSPWVTPRVLNRQIKSVLDELLLREMTHLFEAFAKSLKPKSRREWAPCLAAFLVLCLFMEAVETAADTFVMSQNEIDLRAARAAAPQLRRRFALEANRELENLPFRQFAYQFHQIYATHSREANTRGFNPLVDEDSLQQAGLDTGAVGMVLRLRQLVTEKASWEELDFLCADPILPDQAEYSYPRDLSYNYTGRLVAKFLLSFTDEKYIFGPY